MEDYSEKQIENWDKSKRIVRYKSKQQLDEFVAKAISDKSFNKKMYFGIVPKALAKRILDDFGVDISNKNVSLSASEIRKIMEDHGTLEEIKRGQKQIEASDFLRIIDVFEDTDEISPAGDYNGRPAFNYIKRKEGRTVVFAYDSVKRNDLIVQTMYINVKKEDLATPTGEQAPINTPEANNGTVFPNGKILLSKKNSNSLSDKNMTVQDGKARWTDERIDSLIRNTEQATRITLMHML